MEIHAKLKSSNTTKSWTSLRLQFSMILTLLYIPAWQQRHHPCSYLLSRLISPRSIFPGLCTLPRRVNLGLCTYWGGMLPGEELALHHLDCPFPVIMHCYSSRTAQQRLVHNFPIRCEVRKAKHPVGCLADLKQLVFACITINFAAIRVARRQNKLL